MRLYERPQIHWSRPRRKPSSAWPLPLKVPPPQSPGLASSSSPKFEILEFPRSLPAHMHFPSLLISRQSGPVSPHWCSHFYPQFRLFLLALNQKLCSFISFISSFSICLLKPAPIAINKPDTTCPCGAGSVIRTKKQINTSYQVLRQNSCSLFKEEIYSHFIAQTCGRRWKHQQTSSTGAPMSSCTV